MKQVILLLFACIFFSALLAQSWCGFDETQKRLLKDKNYVKALRQTEQNIRNYIVSHPARRGNSASDGNTTKIVPVVVHIMIPGILSNTCSYNPSDQDVINAIDFLNKIYSGDASAGMTVPSATVAGNMELKFELAKRTPLNSPTNGIERIYATCLQGYDDNGIQHEKLIGCKERDLKSLASWDPSSYLNIWLVNKIDGNDGCVDDGVEKTAGYGTFPNDDLDAKLDGIVLLARIIINPLNKPSTKGILAHEIGHYFSLYHPFHVNDLFDGDENTCPPGSAIDCRDSGDKVCDTDPVTRSSVPRKGNNPCTNFPYKENTENNIMSYTDVRTLFTINQKERFIAGENLARRVTLFSSDNLALKPPTPNQYFNTCTNPVFTTNDFTCIGVAQTGSLVQIGSVWVGTDKQGLYRFNGTSWEKEPFLSTYSINDIKADRSGGIWVAQSGGGSTITQSGGIEHFSNSTLNYDHFNHLNGLPGTNVKSLFIDTARLNKSFPLIWSANQLYRYYGTNYDGGICRGLNTLYPTGSSFNNISGSGIVMDGNGGAQYIGGNATEVWIIAPLNYGNRTQIVRYNAITNAVLGYHDGLGVPELQNFTGTAIYFDVNSNKWIGKSEGGVVVKTSDDQWHAINFPNIFSTETAITYINSNAITGDKFGNVFIGTNHGLVVYNGGPIDLECSYKRYTTDDGLTSNNVKGISIDPLRNKLLIATENGINFWSPINTIGTSTQPYATTASGDLSSPSTWCGGTVPPPTSDVFVKHPITITTNTTLNSLKVETGGSVTVLSGVLTLTNQH